MSRILARILGGILIPLTALTVAACTDAQLSSAVEKHRAFVCSHQATVTAAASYTIDHASTLFKDENARGAAVALAKTDLAIVEICGK